MQPDNSTLVALAGLVSCFVCLVFLWIIGFRQYQRRMVTTTTPTRDAEVINDDGGADKPVRVVEVPIAGAVDGGPLLGGRFVETKMRIADRDTGQRRTVRQMTAPRTPPSSPATPVSIPDETPPQDIAQQQTQMLPIFRIAKVIRTKGGQRWIVGEAMPPDMLPRDYWN